ncbi:MAG: hypothetical protein KY445_09460 [Armatimonadetes bacterium]|nr:hypothetical protein [Armatimonadota bacterium]
MNHHSHEANAPESENQERRRPTWQQNDRRKSRPWVVDISDRRSGFDRRLQTQHGERRD